MNDPTEFQSLVKRVLTETPMTAKEIAEKTGGSVMMVRLVMASLEKQGHAISMGVRPIRYCAVKMPAKLRQREDYRGEPMPYLRPGSYSPPAQPRITLVGIEMEPSPELGH